MKLYMDHRKIYELSKKFQDFNRNEKINLLLIAMKNNLRLVNGNSKTEKYEYQELVRTKNIEYLLHIYRYDLIQFQNIKIKEFEDIYILFDKLEGYSYYKRTLILNLILWLKGYCPLVFYAFNKALIMKSCSEIEFSQIMELSIWGLYRCVSVKDKNKIDVKALNLESGAMGYIYVKGKRIYKFPKTYFSQVYGFYAEYECAKMLSQTKANKYMPGDYVYKAGIIEHALIEGISGEMLLARGKKLSILQIYKLGRTYNVLDKVAQELNLDLHPGNFVWNKQTKKWYIIDLGTVPEIGNDYYKFRSFWRYYNKIWKEYFETIKKVPIRSLDLKID